MLVTQALNKLAINLYGRELQTNDPNQTALLHFFNQAMYELIGQNYFKFFNRTKLAEGYTISNTAFGEDFSSRSPGTLTEAAIIPSGVSNTYYTYLPFILTGYDALELDYVWLPVKKASTGFGACYGYIYVDILDDNDDVVYNLDRFVISNDYVYDIYDNYAIVGYLGGRNISLYFYNLNNGVIRLKGGKTYKIRITTQSFTLTQRTLNCYTNTAPTNSYISIDEQTSTILTADPLYVLCSIYGDAGDYSRTITVNGSDINTIKYLKPVVNENEDNYTTYDSNILQKNKELRNTQALLYQTLTDDYPQGYYFDIAKWDNNEITLYVAAPESLLWEVNYDVAHTDYAITDTITYPDLFVNCALLLAEIKARSAGHGVIDNLQILMQQYTQAYERLCYNYAEQYDNILP